MFCPAVAWGESFAGVLAAARTGQQWAWDAIYRELAPSVLGYLRARGAAEAEDVLGEVFLQVVRDLARFEGAEEDFRAWVFTIAHHRLLDERRRSARRPVEPSPVIEDAVGGDVEQETFARVGEARVQRLLAGLSSDQRNVLLLRLVADLTVEQVARLLGTTPGAVKALQRRALAVLRREISRPNVTL